MKAPSPSQLLKASWKSLSRVPGGDRAFSKIVGRMAPYTGTIGARIVELEPGFARATLQDRKAVRNHLGSVHAIALANFGEFVSGVAMLFSLDDNMRAILTGLHVDYLRKARGELSATCRLAEMPGNEKAEIELNVEIRDADGQLCCRVRPVWLVGPRS
jgi:uncharacterized protein (TIGR00369 family)